MQLDDEQNRALKLMLSRQSVLGLFPLAVRWRTGSEMSTMPCVCVAGVKVSGLSAMFPQATESAASARLARSATPSPSAMYTDAFMSPTLVMRLRRVKFSTWRINTSAPEPS